MFVSRPEIFSTTQLKCSLLQTAAYHFFEIRPTLFCQSKAEKQWAAKLSRKFPKQKNIITSFGFDMFEDCFVCSSQFSCKDIAAQPSTSSIKLWKPEVFRLLGSRTTKRSI